MKTQYKYKRNILSLEIKSKIIDINNNYIKINYIVLDNNEEYEFYIEMSDY